MEENDHRHPIRAFFGSMSVCIILTAIKIDLVGIPLVVIVKNLFIAMVYCLTLGITAGIGTMLGYILYLYLKKNQSYEQQYWV